MVGYTLWVTAEILNMLFEIYCENKSDVIDKPAQLLINMDYGKNTAACKSLSGWIYIIFGNTKMYLHLLFLLSLYVL